MAEVPQGPTIPGDINVKVVSTSVQQNLTKFVPPKLTAAQITALETTPELVEVGSFIYDTTNDVLRVFTGTTFDALQYD